jgi:glycosyltransferase involved in cell wall biosynthesis
MRVLVYPRDLELGGSSINALDLAVALRNHGHDTMVFARPGPLADRVRANGLPLVTVPVPDRPRPSPLALRALRETVRRYRIDLVHSYEFWPCVEAFFGAGVRGVPVLGTVMSMELADYLPRTVPLTVGYSDLLDEARSRRSAPAHLLEPPVDTSIDRPGVDTSGLVERFGVNISALTVAIVSRAAVVMKQEGIERAIDSVAALAATADVQLLVVGGGSALPAIEARAKRVNEAAGRPVVLLTGPLADPRPAYELADVVVGMGSSVLRAMAFAKPAVVVGVDGFSLPVVPEALPTFDRTGFYSVGAGRPAAGADPLTGQLGMLLADADRRAELGQFGLQLVQERFSLDVAAKTLDRIYLETVERTTHAWRRTGDAVGTAVRIAHDKVRRGGVVRRLRRAARRSGT